MPHLPRLLAAGLVCLIPLCGARVEAVPQGDSEPQFVSPPAVESPDAAALIDKAREALAAGRTTSDILADPVFLPVHAHTRFRTLIRDNARSSKTTLVTPGEAGEALIATGTVRDAAGRPVAGALVYVYQTSAKGWYSDRAPHLSGMGGDTRHARLFGYMTTGADGVYEFRTIRPAGYPRTDLPAHIHFQIDPPGGAGGPIVSEIQFDDDPRLTAEWRERSRSDRFVIARPSRDAAGVWHVTADFSLR